MKQTKDRLERFVDRRLMVFRNRTDTVKRLSIVLVLAIAFGLVIGLMFGTS